LSEFGTLAYTVNKDQITNLSNAYLSRMVNEQAQKYDEVLKKIKTASSLQAKHITHIYNNRNILAEKSVGKPLSLIQNSDTHLFYSPECDMIYGVTPCHSHSSEFVKAAGIKY